MTPLQKIIIPLLAFISALPLKKTELARVLTSAHWVPEPDPLPDIFFYTRPDSVSENPEATRILKYPVLSNIPGKSEVWGTPRHEKGNQKKKHFSSHHF